jgi:hypothetical protein
MRSLQEIDRDMAAAPSLDKWLLDAQRLIGAYGMAFVKGTMTDQVQAAAAVTDHLAHLRNLPSQQPEGCAGKCGGDKTAQYRDALVWALGAHETDGFRERYAGDPAYWWRKELQERAGFEWDGEKFIDRAAPGAALSSPAEQPDSDPEDDPGFPFYPELTKPDTVHLAAPEASAAPSTTGRTEP